MSARRSLSQEERALWRAATSDVRRRAGRGAAAPAPEAPSAAPRDPNPRRAAPHLPAPSFAALTPDRAPGLDRRTEERFRRGRMPVEARLDLHGMTQAEAHAALGDFLAAAQDAGRRCVLVITGKGFRRGDDGAAGVLRGAAPRWLNEPANRARLLAFAPAQAKDGGAGALYLLLKRRRGA